jgi:hypothetical protein
MGARVGRWIDMLLHCAWKVFYDALQYTKSDVKAS